MSYPLERQLPQLATVRADAMAHPDAATRELILQLCAAIDYLNAKVHAVADAVPTVLEE